MPKKSRQKNEAKNLGTLWQNNTNPERCQFIKANENLKTAFEQVLWVNDPVASDRELRQWMRLTVDKNLNVPVIELIKPIAGEMAVGQIRGILYCYSSNDIPLLLTAQIYDDLVQVFSDCNPERTRECQRLLEHFTSELLARAIPLGKKPGGI